MSLGRMPAVIFLESLTFLNAISGNWSDTNLLFLLTNSKEASTWRVI